MSSPFSLEVSRDESAWDRFIRDSVEGTIFVESHYLAALESPHVCYFVRKGQERRGALVVMLNDQGQGVLHDHVIHHGLMFAKEPASRSNAKRLSDRFDITEYLAQALPEIYPVITLALPPQVEDMRPYLWHNYGGDEVQRWSLDLRYTSYLEIDGCGSSDLAQNPLFERLGKSRRQEVRYARRDAVFAEILESPEGMLELYRLTMEKGGTTVPKAQLQAMLRLMEQLQAAGCGVTYGVRNPQGEVISASYFCWDNKRAYFLFGGNHPHKKSRYAGTVALWDAFRDLNRRGITVVDMEGVNSPWRGWFKLSFGGSLLPYYEVSFGS
ncbi:MAG: GNAT family N-acetyltransferase [Magnetococcales bacterium]|nr:GNAT family N-acetyltransferase [Magnetococcales bacterium]